MSWRSGAQLFAEMWPLVRAHIPEQAARQAFTARLLALFVDFDVEPADLADLAPEVRQGLLSLGLLQDAEPAISDEVAGCVRQLAAASEKDRVTAAQAIEFFVHQADEVPAAAAAALPALTGALRDDSVKVRRAAAKAIAGMLADGFALSEATRTRMQPALQDEDHLVRRRVEQALARVDTPPGKRKRGS